MAKKKRGYCYGSFLGRRDVKYITPFPEEVMERVTTGKPLFPMDDEFALRWLDCQKAHNALETGQPISIPLSSFELTINHHDFDLEPPEMKITFSQFDSNQIMKALSDFALKEKEIKPWLGYWDVRAIPTIHGPSPNDKPYGGYCNGG